MSNPDDKPVLEAKGPDLSIAIYGGILDYDGAGNYPGLELLNLVFGTDAAELLPTVDTVLVRRRAQDFARKLVWDEDFDSHPKRKSVLLDTATEESLAGLLECLQMEIPSTNKRPGWDRAHFFPYTRSLIHYDARRAKNTQPNSHKVGIERRYMRGGGALAFKVLREDQDTARLSACRIGFAELYKGTDNSPLDRLAKTLGMQGYSDEEAVPDQIESRSRVFNDDIDDLLRDGVVRILSHTNFSTVTRVKSLMNWTSMWLVIAQMVRSSRYLDREEKPIIVDCGGGSMQLRRASQRCLKDNLTLIIESVDAARCAAFGDNARLSNKQRNKIRGFYWASAATVKLLNSWRGRRHFTLGLNALETLVLAGSKPGSEMTFDSFANDWLYRKCRMVIGRSSAHSAGLLRSFDASIYEDNEATLITQMAAAGLLTEYSDATRMVGTGGLR